MKPQKPGETAHWSCQYEIAEPKGGRPEKANGDSRRAFAPTPKPRQRYVLTDATKHR